MDTKRVPFEELPITDRFMFAMVFSHKEIPKRTRYYQAMCDSELLNKGEVYYNLKELYIMFLCPEDIFGQGKAVYRFMNLEVDNPKIELGDHCFKNF